MNERLRQWLPTAEHTLVLIVAVVGPIVLALLVWLLMTVASAGGSGQPYPNG